MGDGWEIEDTEAVEAGLRGREALMQSGMGAIDRGNGNEPRALWDLWFCFDHVLF